MDGGELAQKLLATCLQKSLKKWGFEEVDIGKASQREKVFEFRLRYGDAIRVLTAISNSSKQNKIFCRKSFKVGFVDKDGEYFVHSQFPKLAIVDNSRGNIGKIMDNLVARIRKICEEMEDQYYYGHDKDEDWSEEENDSVAL